MRNLFLFSSGNRLSATRRRSSSAAAAVAICLLASACVSTIDSDARPDEVEAAPSGESDGGGETAAGDEEPGDDRADEADTRSAGEPAVGAVADPAAMADLEMVPCSFDERIPLPVEPSCYAISVPENWADPDQNDQVVLQAAVFAGDGSLADPIIYFDGGPGAHTLDVLAFSFARLIEPFLGQRDYIVFDQRGVGLSEPSLACPELTEVALEELAGRIDAEVAASATVDAQGACRDRLLGGGVDLAAYNSIASANDVEAMRSLFGYEQLNVVGISYGTRLAQTYMRMYPQSVRSVVLDSVFPTGYDLWSNFNPGAVRAFEQFFDGCADSTACSEAFPELEDRFFQLLDQLDAEPAELEVPNLLTGDRVPLLVDGDDLMGLVFSALYDRARFAVVPQMVEDGLAGDYTTIELLGSILVNNIDFVSQGMRLSVECNEEIPFESEDVLVANQPTEGPYLRLAGSESGLTLFDLCPEWPAGVAPDVEADPIVSDLPTLVLAGQYDPITPPAGAGAVAEGLSASYTFLLPHEGHGIAPSSCGTELVNAFIDDPRSEPASACIASSPEPVWTPPVESGPIELVEFEVSGLVSVSGLRPADWTDVGNGAFVRQQTALDPTTLLVQPTNGLPPETLVELLSGQLDLEFSADGTVDIDGDSWSLFSTPPVSDQAARIGFGPGPDGVLVLLVADGGEIDSLYDALFIPVAAAAEPG